MSTVIVKQFPSSVSFFDVRTVEQVRALKEKYLTVGEVQIPEVGEDAAEEMFDLMNNPNRVDESVKLFGNVRSLSVGDIVLVDGVEYTCLPIGWCVL